MPNKNNIAMLEKVKESIANSKGFFVIDYRGLTVKESQ
jgi:large subunit ribosomal protein L10